MAKLILMNYLTQNRKIKFNPNPRQPLSKLITTMKKHQFSLRMKTPKQLEAPRKSRSVFTNLKVKYKKKKNKLNCYRMNSLSLKTRTLSLYIYKKDLANNCLPAMNLAWNNNIHMLKNQKQKKNLRNYPWWKNKKVKVQQGNR